MSPLLLLLAVSASVALASTGLAIVIAVRSSTTVPEWLGRYRRWWNARTVELRAHPKWKLVPPVQLWSAPALVIVACGTGLFGLVVPAVLIAGGPPLLLRDRARRRRASLAQQLDGTLTALANALSTTPNLGDALGSLLDIVDGPMHQEITAVLGEVRIGRPIDEALTALARRSQIPGFEAAVAAAIMGRRTGGDLPEILRRTSGTLREMARLEGVLRTKTAEGRSQALVMGLVPPLLILALHKIDPHWLEPLWHDPIGWIILGVAALFEVAAIALIKRIMAVDL